MVQFANWSLGTVRVRVGQLSSGHADKWTSNRSVTTYTYENWRAWVVVSLPQADVLAAAANEINATIKSESGACALSVPTELGDQKSVQRLFEQAQQRFGRIDVLFNNAGCGAPARVNAESPRVLLLCAQLSVVPTGM